MYEIPTAVVVGEQSFAIRNKGDYRVVLDCFSALSDMELSETERTYASLIIFYEQFNDIEDLLLVDKDTIHSLVNEMYKFFKCGEEDIGIRTNFKAIDWESDQQLICSAVNKVANQEIRTTEYLHWWTFMGYFMEVGESVLATVVSIRNKKMKGKKLEKYEREFIRSNPQYFVWDSRTAEQKANDAYFENLWNSNS